MTKDEVLAQIEALGDPTRKAQNARRGVKGEQVGAKNGDLRTLARAIKADRALALELWETGHYEGRLLAILLLRPSHLSAEELDALVRSTVNTWVADWLNSYLVKKHKAREQLRAAWMDDANPMAQRAGWNLTSIRVEKDPDGLDLSGLLDRIQAELADADPLAQWTMNFTLVSIGIHAPALRERALAIGEALGVYRDFPVSKGCTSPFAPAWIDEMVRRQA